MCELTHGMAGERHGRGMEGHAMCESALSLMCIALVRYVLLRCMPETKDCQLHIVLALYTLYTNSCRYYLIVV